MACSSRLSLPHLRLLAGGVGTVAANSPGIGGGTAGQATSAISPGYKQ